MHISVATATFWSLPFEQTLEIIAGAGFEYIELDLYWERGEWAMAQHLKHLETSEVARLVEESGLKVSSIHDAGGVIHGADSIQGFIDPQLEEYLDQLGYAPGCIVFHTPHIKGDYDDQWWEGISAEIAVAARRFKTDETTVTIENMPTFDGYYVPLSTPEKLMDFVSENELNVTLDTTHYPQIGIDPIKAASILREKIRSIHLSDFFDGKTHLFVGDGCIDFVKLFRVFDPSVLHSITLECSLEFPGETVLETKEAKLIDKLKTARKRLDSWIEAAQPSRRPD